MTATASLAGRIITARNAKSGAAVAQAHNKGFAMVAQTNVPIEKTEEPSYFRSPAIVGDQQSPFKEAKEESLTMNSLLLLVNYSIFFSTFIGFT